MKSIIKRFIVGICVTVILISGVVYASGNSATLEVVINNINIALNGKVVGVEGANFTLSNGEEVPFSILYKGTTYLPMRKVSELLGKEVTWDGITRTAGIVDTSEAEVAVVVTQNNSRTNPAGIGEKLVLECENYIDSKYSMEMTLTEIIRGQAAENMVIAGNKFNDESGSDKEYVLAKIKIKILKTENDSAVSINNAMFDTVSSNGVVEEDFYVVAGLEPDLSREYYSGSEFEGYTYFLVDEGDQSVARFKIEYEKYVWLKLY